MLQAAFPFQHRPGRIVVLRELRENAGEIDLSVAERAEAAGALDPGRIAGIDALPAGRIELGVLHVKGLDALVIDVDEGEIVELLQHEMRGIVVDRAALVAFQRVEEPLEGRAVEHVLAGMDFIADVDAGLVKALRIGFQRCASSSKAVSIRPGARCGQG